MGISFFHELAIEAMNVYFAGWCAAIPKGHMPTYLTFIAAQKRRIRELSSFVESGRPPVWRQVMAIADHRCDFFLDSGAYTAWKQGEPIDIEAYLAFILDHAEVFTAVANLDVIPGSWGHIPTPLEIDASAEAGWKNYYWLKERFEAHEAKTGKKLPFAFVHIYHQGESLKWLDKLLAEGGSYIGISPGNDRSTEQKMEWLDAIFSSHLTDAQGWPLRNMHAFGVTSVELLTRYPWYSVDSTSWVLSGRYGIVYIPLPDAHGKTKVHKVAFSDQSPRMREESEHFRTMPKPAQERIRVYLKSKGFTPEELATEYVRRDQANIQFFLDFERQHKPTPFERRATRQGFGLG